MCIACNAAPLRMPYDYCGGATCSNGVVPMGDALVTWCRDGNGDRVWEGLAEGADPNASHRDGSTPLLAVAHRGHEEIVGVLLGAGAELNRPSEGGATPLFLGAQAGHEHIVAMLLAAGAAVDKATKAGATPLLVAAQNGHVGCVTWLLGAGAGLNKAPWALSSVAPAWVPSSCSLASSAARVSSAGGTASSTFAAPAVVAILCGSEQPTLSSAPWLPRPPTPYTPMGRHEHPRHHVSLIVHEKI